MAFEGIPMHPQAEERPTTTVKGSSLSVGDVLMHGGEAVAIRSKRTAGQDIMVTLENGQVTSIDHDEECEVVSV